MTNEPKNTEQTPEMTENPPAERPVTDQETELEALRTKVRAYEQAEEEQRLMGAAHGDAYRRWRDEIHQLADYAHARGRAISLTAAFHAVLIAHLDELLEEAAVRAGHEALAQRTANESATPNALRSEATDDGVDYARMSDAEFDRVLRMALNGELKRG